MRWSDTRDLTMRQRDVTPGQRHLLLFLCGHKGVREGSSMRGAIPWRCPACNTKAEAKR